MSRPGLDREAAHRKTERSRLSMSEYTASPPTSEQPEVVDQRRHNFTIIDNEVFDLYAEHIGPSGIAVYAALIRFAHQDSGAFPSHANLAKKSGMSVRSVQTHLANLTSNNPNLAKNGLAPLIEIRHRRRKDGGQSSNLYLILPIAKGAHTVGTDCRPPSAQVADEEEAGEEEVLRTDIAPKQKPKPKRATVIPDDFALTNATLKWASEKGYAAPAVMHELEKFTNHHAAKGTRMVDWQRAFMTWMGNAKDWGHVTPIRQDTPPPTGHRHPPGLFGQEILDWYKNNPQGDDE